jgi:hypothetical protein
MSGAEHDKGFEGSGFAEVGGVGQECVVAEGLAEGSVDENGNGFHDFRC